MADKYALPIYPMLEKRLPSQPITHYRNCADYLDQNPGETPNHLEQRLALLYGKNPEESRHLILEWYGTFLDKYGMDAKPGTDEAIFSTSHWGHFGAARGPILFFALREKDLEVIDCMIRVWRMMMAAAQLLRTPKWEIIAPGARFFGNANQTKECNRTFRWIATGTLDKKISNLTSSPSYLGLHSLMLIDRCKIEMKGSKEFVLDLIGAGDIDSDLPPLKNPLIVHRSESGHVAEFLSTDKMLNPARWAWTDYRSGRVVYGLDSSVVERMKLEQKKVEEKNAGKRKYKLWPDEVEVVIDKEAMECPGKENGKSIREYRFPIAGKKNREGTDNEHKPEIDT